MNVTTNTIINAPTYAGEAIKQAGIQIDPTIATIAFGVFCFGTGLWIMYKKCKQYEIDVQKELTGDEFDIYTKLRTKKDNKEKEIKGFEKKIGIK